MSDPDVAIRIEAAAGEFTEENEKFDNKADELENRAMLRVERFLNTAKFSESLVALKTLNQLKRRRDTAPATRQGQGTVVQLQLPQIAQTTYIMNQQSEIIEVEGRTMISANSEQLARLAMEKLGRVPVDPTKSQLSEIKSQRAEELLTSIELNPEIRKRARASTNMDITDIL